MTATNFVATLRDIDTIQPYMQNAKIHDPKQVKKIAASISEFGWTGNPIVVNGKGVILAGHGRRLAAISLGMKEVPVAVVAGLSDKAERAYRLADNRVAIANTDTDILQKELAGLECDMSQFFDKKELDFVLADMGELNESAFVDDLDAEILAQSEEVSHLLTETAEAEVPIGRALGFKSIKGKDERFVAVFMAQLQGETGKDAADAFVEFVKTFSGASRNHP